MSILYRITVMEHLHKIQGTIKWKKFYSLSSLEDIHSWIYIQKPSIVGIMEHGENGEIKVPHHMSYFRTPKQCEYPLDLNKSFENYKYRPENKFSNSLDLIAAHIMSDKNNANPKIEVVTHRGLLAALMKVPYYEILRRSFKILAIQYKNKLYLMRGFENSDLFPSSAHHFKFKQYLFSDDPGSQPNSNVAIDEKEQLYCIYRSQLDNLHILYSAEVFGIISEKKIENFNNLNECRFVVTKLVKEHETDLTTKPCIIDWWTKAYLVAVEDLYLGVKNKDGFVTQPIKHYAVKELAENQSWSPKVCIKCMHTFINKIIEEMKGVDSLDTCYEFSFDHRKGCFYSRVHEGKTSYSFLPEDFVAYLKK